MHQPLLLQLFGQASAAQYSVLFGHTNVPEVKPSARASNVVPSGQSISTGSPDCSSGRTSCRVPPGLQAMAKQSGELLLGQLRMLDAGSMASVNSTQRESAPQDRPNNDRSTPGGSLKRKVHRLSRLAHTNSSSGAWPTHSKRFTTKQPSSSVPTSGSTSHLAAARPSASQTRTSLAGSSEQNHDCSGWRSAYSPQLFVRKSQPPSSPQSRCPSEAWLVTYQPLSSARALVSEDQAARRSLVLEAV
mmetsp:Transcript_7378/g.20830  ORF Transcript_7378/g.20830 Transcript_7378/m.20830 type:complete len:246 (+) Transcript_7378:2063-2800(+)